MSKLTAFGVIYLLVSFSVILYHVKEDLGLVNPAPPKFVVGDCVREEFKSEFYTRYHYNYVKSVGKQEYLLLNYYVVEETNTGRAYGDSYARTIKYFDRDNKKTDCPTKIIDLL